MGRIFWPVYIIVAAVALAATWWFAPMVGEKMPAGSRDKIRDIVAKCLGRELAAEAVANPVECPVEGAPAAKPSDGVTPLTETAAVSAKAARPDKRAAKPAARVVTPTAKPAARVVAPATGADDEEELPSLKGIMQTDASVATWGVLNQATTVTGLDGVEQGRVAGGRIFLIESRERTSRGLWLIGNFYPTPLAEPVRVPSVNLYCFSGKPQSLSQRQRDCLRMYYQLRGEALDYKNKLVRENVEKSPFGRKAVEAKRLFDAKAKEVENSSSGANARAKNELSRLRERFLDLQEKHRVWKEQHASELPDPEKNPEYLKKLKASRAYAAPIAGLAF